jgi:hypothetical protein
MQNPFGILILIVFGGVGLISIFTVIGLLLPLPVQRTRTTLESSLGRSLLLGALNFLCIGVVDVFFIWLAQLFSSVKVIGGILVIIGGLITLTLALLTILGLVSLANLLGHRIGEPKNDFETLLRGGALLFLAGLTPYLGWFVFAPLAIWISLGAAIQTLFKRKEKAA